MRGFSWTVLPTCLTSTELWLGSLYQNNVDFQTLVRFWAFSLVPEEDIVRTWDNVISSRYDELKPRWQFWSGWFILRVLWEDMDRSTQVENRRQEESNIQFGTRMKQFSQMNHWPVMLHRGFNAAFALSLPNNASIWALMQQLRTEEIFNDRKMRDVLMGPQNNVATASTKSQPRKRSKKNRF